MTVEQYRWMQRAHFINETVQQLTLALNAASGATPETAGNPPPNLITTNQTVSAFSDQIARLGTTSSDPRQAALDDRALLYLQQLLIEQGLTMAPSAETLTQQLVHPEMTRRATKFLVNMYKLRKAVKKAKKAKRVSDHDAVILQANVLLDEYLMTKDGGSDDIDSSTSTSYVSDCYRKQNLVQHVLGAHLGDMCNDKQCLILHVEANVTRKVESWGWCCQDVVLAGAQAQVNFLIDMTRHHESSGTQYAGMFLLHAKPQRISVMDDYYESFNLLADRSLWDTTRDNVDTPVAAAAPVVTDPDMVGETTMVKKKIVRRKKAKSDDEAEKRKIESTHSILSMSSASGARKGKSVEDREASNHKIGSRQALSGAGKEKPPNSGRASAGRGAGDTPSRRASAGRGAEGMNTSRRASAGRGSRASPDPSGHTSKPVQSRSSSGHAAAQPIPEVSQSGRKTALRKPSGGGAVTDTGQPVKALRKPSGGELVEQDETSESSPFVADRRKSGDTAPSFYDVSVDSPESSPEVPQKSSVQQLKSDGSTYSSNLIPEIEKLGKLGEEVAAILRSPSKHGRETASRTSRSSGKKDDESVATSDSQPITLRPKPPPVADQSVGESVVLFQPPGDKITSMSFRASDFNQPTTPTTAAYTNTTGSTTITTLGGSASGTSSYQAGRTPPNTGVRRPSQDNTRSQSAPAGRTKTSDPPAFRAPSQREQMARKEMDTSRSKIPRKSSKKDSV